MCAYITRQVLMVLLIPTLIIFFMSDTSKLHVIFFHLCVCLLVGVQSKTSILKWNDCCLCFSLWSVTELAVS
jgi:hypothetical protein